MTFLAPKWAECWPAIDLHGRWHQEQRKIMTRISIMLHIIICDRIYYTTQDNLKFLAKIGQTKSICVNMSKRGWMAILKCLLMQVVIVSCLMNHCIDRRYYSVNKQVFKRTLQFGVERLSYYLQEYFDTPFPISVGKITILHKNTS